MNVNSAFSVYGGTFKRTYADIARRNLNAIGRRAEPCIFFLLGRIVNGNNQRLFFRRLKLFRLQNGIIGAACFKQNRRRGSFVYLRYNAGRRVRRPLGRLLAQSVVIVVARFGIEIIHGISLHIDIRILRILGNLFVNGIDVRLRRDAVR